MRPTVILCSLFAGICYASVVAADIPEDVAALLRKNAAQLTPLEISWTYRPKSLVSEDRLVAEYGESDLTRFRADRKVTVFLDGAKIFQRARTPQGRFPETGQPQALSDEIGFSESEKAFDNEYWYSGTGTDEVQKIGATPVLTVERLADVRKNLKGKLFRLDYFENVGFFVAQTTDELGTPPLSLLMHADPALTTSTFSTEELEGEKCYKITSVSSAATTISWLSESKHGALIRSETSGADGNVISRTQNGDFVKLRSRDVWLPKNVDRHLYRWNNKGPLSKTPVVVEEFRVTHWSDDPITAQQFTLKYDDVPGSIVSDSKLADTMHSTLDKVQYRVPANQDDLNRVIENASLGKADVLIPRRSVWSKAIIAVNVLVLLALGVIWWFRKKAGH